MEPSLWQIGSGVGLIVASASVAIAKSYRSGRLGHTINRVRGQGDKMNGKLDQIHDSVEETYEETRNNGQQIEKIGETVALLHEDDEGIDDSELRDRLGVDDLDGDLFTND